MSVLARAQMVIFDWDGTLSDSRSQVVDCMRRAAIACHWPLRSEAEYAHGIGLSLAQHFAALYPEATGAQLQALLMAYRQAYFSSAQPHRLFEGVRETLSHLSACGVLLAVATGKGKRGLSLALQETDLARWFVTTRTAEETAHKPHPLMLQEILAEYALSAEQALMVGDTSFDLQMAAAIGMPSVAVSYGVHERALLEAYQPTALIDDIRQLPGLLSA